MGIGTARAESVGGEHKGSTGGNKAKGGEPKSEEVPAGDNVVGLLGVVVVSPVMELLQSIVIVVVESSAVAKFLLWAVLQELPGCNDAASMSDVVVESVSVVPPILFCFQGKSLFSRQLENNGLTSEAIAIEIFPRKPEVSTGSYFRRA